MSVSILASGPCLCEPLHAFMHQMQIVLALGGIAFCSAHRKDPHTMFLKGLYQRDRLLCERRDKNRTHSTTANSISPLGPALSVQLQKQML